MSISLSFAMPSSLFSFELSVFSDQYTFLRTGGVR
jgi:hypothetical protein